MEAPIAREMRDNRAKFEAKAKEWTTLHAKAQHDN